MGAILGMQRLPINGPDAKSLVAVREQSANKPRTSGRTAANCSADSGTDRSTGPRTRARGLLERRRHELRQRFGARGVRGERRIARGIDGARQDVLRKAPGHCRRDVGLRDPPRA